MGVNKVVYNNTTLIDLTGDTVTEETLAEGVVAHDASGKQIVGKMATSSEMVDNTNTVVTIFPADGSVKEYHADGSTLETLFNDDESITEIETKNGETKTKRTTFTAFGVIEMYTDDGNQILYGETKPAESVGIDGDVFILRTQKTKTYKPITSIISRNGGYFDAGVICSDDMEFEIKWRDLDNYVAKSLFGMADDTNKGFLVLYENKLYIGSASVKTISVSTLNTDYTLNVKTTSAKKWDATLNGTTMSGTFSQSLTTMYTFWLLSQNPFPERARNAELYYSKIKKGGILIRDYVPYIDENDKPCLYDKVSNTFNYGVGVFSAGAETGEEPLVIPLDETIERAMYMKIDETWTLIAEEVT